MVTADKLSDIVVEAVGYVYVVSRRGLRRRIGRAPISEHRYPKPGEALCHDVRHDVREIQNGSGICSFLRNRFHAFLTLAEIHAVGLRHVNCGKIFPDLKPGGDHLFDLINEVCFGFLDKKLVGIARLRIAHLFKGVFRKRSRLRRKSDPVVGGKACGLTVSVVSCRIADRRAFLHFDEMISRGAESSVAIRERRNLCIAETCGNFNVLGIVEVVEAFFVRFGIFFGLVIEEEPPADVAFEKLIHAVHAAAPLAARDVEISVILH